MNKENQQNLLVEMVMRQTSYSYEEAKNKLEENNNDYMIVIKNSLGIKKKTDDAVTSVNQQIYKEIRGLMDTAADTFRQNQEREKKKQEMIELLRKEQERRQEHEKNIKQKEQQRLREEQNKLIIAEETVEEIVEENK